MSRFIVITSESKGSVALMLLRRRRTNTLFQENNNDDTEAPSVLDLADMRPTPEANWKGLQVLKPIDGSV